MTTIASIAAVIIALALGAYVIARLLFPVRIDWNAPTAEPTEHGGHITALEIESRRNVERIARMEE